MPIVERPDIVTEAMLIYLDELRESGLTSMFGAPAYVEEVFNTTKEESWEITGYWLDTFGDREVKGIKDVYTHNMQIK